jgi:hypothetical protein
MERPSSASIWQPLLDDRPKETLLPKTLSTADLSSAWHTGLVFPPPLSSPPLSEDGEADVLGDEEDDESSDEGGEPDGEAVT